MNPTRKFFTLLLSTVVSTLTPGAITTAQALPVDQALPVAWSFYQHHSSDELRNGWQQARDSGLMPVDIEVAPHTQQHLSIWEENIYGEGWVSWYGLSEQEFTANATRYKARGYLIADQDLSTHGDDISYALVMRENATGIPWKSYTAIDATRLHEVIEQHSDELQPVAIDALEHAGNTLFSVVLAGSTNADQWRFENRLSHDAYAQRLTQHKADGFQPADTVCYLHNGQLHYAAIWQRPFRHSNKRAAYYGMTATDMRNQVRQLADQGLRLSRVSACPAVDGQPATYAGIWSANDKRFHWPAGQTARQLLSDYASVDEIPGVSAAIVHNGRVL
ncbi:MAG: hypothetical protein AAF404_20305, partial [Pseudomonadota bacterium]